MKLSNKFYNALKFVALVLLPAVSTLYVALAGVLDLPNVEQVVGTIAAVDTFLGLLLKSASSQYLKGAGTDGDLIVTEDEGEKYLALGVSRPALQRIPGKDTVTLRVVKNELPPA